jgi:hypothetical protein
LSSAFDRKGGIPFRRINPKDLPPSRVGSSESARINTEEFGNSRHLQEIGDNLTYDTEPDNNRAGADIGLGIVYAGKGDFGQNTEGIAPWINVASAKAKACFAFRNNMFILMWAIEPNDISGGYLADIWAHLVDAPDTTITQIDWERFWPVSACPE